MPDFSLLNPEARPKPPPLTKSDVAKEYLTAYNSICTLLWLSIFGRVVLLIPITGYESVYEAAGDITKWTQTVAVLEILHSAFGRPSPKVPRRYASTGSGEMGTIGWFSDGYAGLVRSPLPTTLLQVTSRLLVVWAVVDQFPAETTTSPFYSSMLLAWSATEIVRYSYFVLHLRGSVPGFMTWLRYNMFYVLYPVGITSECMLVWKASEAAGGTWRWVGLGVLGLYVPGTCHQAKGHFGEREWRLTSETLGSYVLYTYMISQRRKVMNGKQAERRNRSVTQ